MGCCSVDDRSILICCKVTSSSQCSNKVLIRALPGSGLRGNVWDRSCCHSESLCLRFNLVKPEGKRIYPSMMVTQVVVATFG